MTFTLINEYKNRLIIIPLFNYENYEAASFVFYLIFLDTQKSILYLVERKRVSTFYVAYNQRHKNIIHSY